MVPRRDPGLITAQRGVTNLEPVQGTAKIDLEFSHRGGEDDCPSHISNPLIEGTGRSR